MNNNRNRYGVKYASNIYRNKDGKFYEQWKDLGYDADEDEDPKKELAKHIAKNPGENFILRKGPDGYRIYHEVKSNNNWDKWDAEHKGATGGAKILIDKYRK